MNERGDPGTGPAGWCAQSIQGDAWPKPSPSLSFWNPSLDMPESDPESTEHEVVVQRGKVLVVRVKAQISAKTIRMYFVTEVRRR